MTPKVCILNEDDARSLVHGGISHKCSTRRHHHYSKAKADALVKAGELRWIGMHHKIATFAVARSWMKVYKRNAAGEVMGCNMQLVRGGATWSKSQQDKHSERMRTGFCSCDACRSKRKDQRSKRRGQQVLGA
jgi:hypothetical protein